MRDDSGSATVWMLGLATVIVLLTMTAVTGGSAVLARHRLERAADLSALAAAQSIGTVVQPCSAAGRVARENGAGLVDCQLELAASGRSGTVAVRLSGTVRLPLLGRRPVVARARAGRLPAVEKGHQITGHSAVIEERRGCCRKVWTSLSLAADGKCYLWHHDLR
jgi:secretion/DNA translocation related TadE-like protein